LELEKRRLSAREIPLAKVALVKRQEGKCPLCQDPLPISNACLDHNHKTGLVRGALCRNCNGIEGKVHNLANRAKRNLTTSKWLGYLILYWLKHETDQTGLYHPIHKTADEKRLITNKKAREKRAAMKREGK
jgi:RNA polymerase subunit RPABC4/transcription elongation factor Spt4